MAHPTHRTRGTPSLWSPVYLFYRIYFFFTCALSGLFAVKTQPKHVKFATDAKISRDYLALLSGDPDQIKELNANIDPVIADKDKLAEILKTPDNYLETQWKSRILFENTKMHGNVIMYYDIYKQAFAYYSDLAVPISALTPIALKYSVTFKCREFYMDTAATTTVTMAAIAAPSVFIKNKQIASRRIASDACEKKTNKFIRMGKILNFSMTQIQKPASRARVSNADIAEACKKILTYDLFGLPDLREEFATHTNNSCDVGSVYAVSTVGTVDTVGSVGTVDGVDTNGNEEEETPNTAVSEPKFSYAQYKQMMQCKHTI